MSDLTTAEYHAVACAYLRGLNSPCRTPEEGERAATRLEADARALWAVRVLDRWAKGSKALEWRVTDCSEQVCCTLQRTVNGGQVADTDYYGPTPDAARIAAAEALVAEDPTLGEGL